MRSWPMVLTMVIATLALPASGNDQESSVCAPSDAPCLKNQLERSAGMGDIISKIELARSLLADPENGSNWKRAAALLRQAAATGDPWSSSILAGLYREGKGVTEDGREVMSLLIPLAAKGSVGAIAGLGDLFAAGAGTIEPDLPRAARYYARASDLGDNHGTYRLALMLLDGNGIPADVPRAVTLLENLSSSGDPWILIQLGNIYAEGRAMPAEDAIQYFERAAATGSAPAMVRLAQIYQTGIGRTSPNFEKSEDLLEKAADLGEVSAQVLLAQMLLAREDGDSTARAIGLLEAASATGAVWPTTILADLYARGTKVPPDGPRAVRLLQAFVDRGEPAALVGLGDIYMRGVGAVPPDQQKARALFARAAETGDLAAKNRLGFMLIEGQGGEADIPLGLALLEPVLAAGDSWALLQLADLYAGGTALPPNAAKAKRYFERAVELGNVAGLSRLGVLYRDGLAGQTPEREIALNYFEQAVAAGDGAARIYLALMLIEPGEAQNPGRAADLLSEAANDGDAWAAGILGGLYADGRVLSPDYRQARQLLKKAEDAGDRGAMLRFGMLLATGPLATDHRAEGVELVEAAVTQDVPGAMIERARLGMLGLIGNTGGVTAERDLRAETEAGNPTALRLLLQLYRSGAPDFKADLGQAQSILKDYADLLNPQEMAFETVALSSMLPVTDRSLTSMGVALQDMAPTDLPQIVQMLFWGNKNAYVYALQQGLQELGLYDGPLSGYLTRPTITAINRACAEMRSEQLCAQGPLTPEVASLLGKYLGEQPPLHHS